MNVICRYYNLALTVKKMFTLPTKLYLHLLHSLNHLLIKNIKYLVNKEGILINDLINKCFTNQLQSLLSEGLKAEVHQ